MKIAYIYPEEIPSKKARSISVINTSLALSKLANVSLFVDSDSELFKIESFYGISLNGLDIRATPKRWLFFKSNKIFHLYLKNSLNEFDILYTRHLKSANFLLRYKKPHQKLIFEVHELFFKTQKDLKKSQKLFELEALIYKHCDGLILINNELKSALNESFKELSSNQLVAYLGTNLPKEPNLNKDFSNIKEGYYIGSLYPWKGIDTLIKAIKKSQLEKLHIYGEANKERISELKGLIDELNLDKRVFLYDAIEHKKSQEILKNSSLLCFLPNNKSEYERFTTPLKLIEYLANNNAVIASDIATVRELTNNCECVLFFEPQNSTDLALKIDELILNPLVASKLAQNGIEKSKEFSWEIRGKKIYEFLIDILKNTKKS